MTASDRAAELRDHGIRQAEAHDRDGWDANVIRQAIADFAATGEPFSANDVRRLLPAVDGQLVGAGFRRARNRGWIEAIGSVLADHAEGHRRLLVLWRGTGALSRTLPRPDGAASSTHTEPPNAAPGQRDVAPGSTQAHDRPPREPIEQKAARLLAEGRVHVVRVGEDSGLVIAAVEGDHGAHRVVRQPTGRWSCNCEAGMFGRVCSHASAVRLVAGPMP